LLVSSASIRAQDINPTTELAFHRQAVRRFVFSQEITLGKLAAGETVGFDAMHPVLKTGSLPPAAYRDIGSGFEISGAAKGVSDSALWVSGINPYANYIAEVTALPEGAELALELATLDRQTGVSVVLTPGSKNFVSLRIFKDGKSVREPVLFTGPAPVPPYDVHVQLYGDNLAVFAIKNGVTAYLGSPEVKESFGDVIDFRVRSVIAKTSFNLATKVPEGGKIVVGGARSVLSSGIGQADIRAISYADGTPYFENNRLWFTFSCRGLGTSEANQGIMSIDPSVFDPRFEGVLVFDRGDGLLRNDYASHVFYDEKAREWRAVTACFSNDRGGRGPSGLAFAHSLHDPRRGFSVMSERQLTPAQLPRHHEDPSLLYDAAAGKWRMLTCCFEKEGIRAELFESDTWDGNYRPIAGPVPYDSTGTQIVKLGSKRYVFSGASQLPNERGGGVLAYSYPELNYLGVVKFDLPASMKGGRVWPNIFELPPGYPARYMAIPMDRMNVPGIAKRNWSYGALYLFWADTPDISTEAK
jgi:hypothetical protein